MTIRVVFAIMLAGLAGCAPVEPYAIQIEAEAEIWARRTAREASEAERVGP